MTTVKQKLDLNKVKDLIIDNIDLLLEDLDLEYEQILIKAGATQHPDIKTRFLDSNDDFSHVSSSVVKALKSEQGLVHELVPSYVNQRLDAPYKKDIKGHLVACSWEEAFKTLAEKIKSIKPKEIAALVGDQACLESVVALKDLMVEFNVENIDCRPMGSTLPTDIKNRSGWLFNPTISSIEECDSILIIGSQPRYEAALLDARIRKTWLAKGLKISRIGGGDSSSYPIEELGNDIDIIDQIYKGKHSYNKILDSSSKPLFIIGENVLYPNSLINFN